MTVTLRPYQEQAVTALLHDAQAGICPVGVIPTGGGKTVVMRELAQRWLCHAPNDHILLLAHRTRLLTQAQERFAGVPTQVVSAGLGLWQEPQPGTVTVASIQTVAGMPEIQKTPWSLVMVDEAHRVGMDSSEESGQYRTFLDALAKRSDPPIVGMTATPWRMEKGMRHVPIFGQDSVFQKASCWIQPEDLIAQGYLLRPTLAKVRCPLPTTGIILPHGELAAANVQQYRGTDFWHRVEEMVRLTRDRKHTLIFADSIKEAQSIAVALEVLGASACVLHGEHGEATRNREIERFRAGEFSHLVNVDVFTEGLDVPEIDAVVLHRRSQSVVRYLQMAGRGLRPPGGTANQTADCLIVDFGQHVERLGPIEAARGEDARPKSWRSRRLRRTAKENPGASEWLGDTLPVEAPDYTEAEAGFCLPVQKMAIVPLPMRGNRAFYLLRFWMDDPGGGVKPLCVERKMHQWDSALQQLLKRLSILSGVALPRYGTTQEGENPWPDVVQKMTQAQTGFLAYTPFAARVRWSVRSGKWMVDGWQWSGKQRMNITVEEERLLSAWVQRVGQSRDPMEKGLYGFLHRLAHSGVLDVQLEEKPSRAQPAIAEARQKPSRMETSRTEPTPPEPAPLAPVSEGPPSPASPPSTESAPASVSWPAPVVPESFPPAPDFRQFLSNQGEALAEANPWPAQEPAVQEPVDTVAASWNQANRLPPDDPGREVQGSAATVRSFP